MEAEVLAEPFLVGRDREIEELRLLLDSVISGNGKTVLISGEAGSGKTRVVNEFLKSVKDRDITIITGWCLSNVGIPYFPFIEAFNPDLSISNRRSDQSRSVLNFWLKNKNEVGFSKRFNVISPQTLKDQIFVAVTNTLFDISVKKPTILFIDDLHWADSASLGLINYLSHFVSSQRILLIATYRSEELNMISKSQSHPLVETLRLMGRENLFKELKLRKLNVEEILRLAESMMGGCVQPAFVKNLAKKSNGNPLFIIEFLRMLSEKGDLVEEDKCWKLLADNFGLPAKIKDIILRRVSFLNPVQKRLLDLASILGSTFNPELLGHMSSQSDLEVLENLGIIANSSLLVKCEGKHWRFDHVTSQEAIYGALSQSLRSVYHRLAAETIERNFKEQKLSVADLAYHYSRSGDREKAVKFALIAGKEALGKWSNQQAIEHFSYALQNVSDTDITERNVALEGLGDAYSANCMYTEAIKTFEQLAKTESGPLQLRALRKAMEAAFTKGDNPDILLEYAKKAEKLGLDDCLEMARVINNRGRAFAWAGRGDVKLDVADYEEALQIFEEKNSLVDVAEALWRIGEACVSAEDLHEKGLGYLLRSRTIFNELGDFRKEIVVDRSIGLAFIYLMFFPEARVELNKVLRVGEKIGDFNELARARGILGLTDEYEGKIEESLSQVLKAFEYNKRTDVDFVQALDLGALTRLYCKLGDLKNADKSFNSMIKLPRSVLSIWNVRFNFDLTKGVYFAAKGKYKESDQIFNSLSADLSLSIREYVWTLEKQGRIEEAKVQKSKIKKQSERIKKLFERANVQLNIMVEKMVHIGEVFELRLDLTNVARNLGTIVKVESLIPYAFKVVSLPSFCSIQNSSIKINNRDIHPFQVETIKIKMLCAKAGVYDFHPCLYYITHLGETKKAKTKHIIITVQPVSFENIRSVAELLKGKLEFKSGTTKKAFDFLVKAFLDDYYGQRLLKEKSGWRTLMEVVKEAKVSMYSMYGRSSRSGKVTLELASLGLIESRFFLKERGRGGRVLKIRIRHEKKLTNGE
jgi:tetratricopeptide (TPR) repeat protein